MYVRSHNANSCPKCSVVFPKGFTAGKKSRHEQLCRRVVVVRCDAPSVPAELVDAYHGGGADVNRDADFDVGDTVVWDDAVDLPYMADMFHDPPPGEQEKAFEEIFMNMMQDPEATHETARNPPPNDRFLHFQRALVRRGTSRNSLNFRSLSGADKIDELINIYAFVRKYTLSMSAGELKVVFAS